jgi:anti-sigma B factor antagonist
MPDVAQKPVFLVDANSHPVVVRISGRASFQNSACLRDFFAEMIRQGKTRLVIDFSQCASMDSTFLGVLAGAALELKKLNPAGSLILARLVPRNLELIRNLGLHRLLTVDAGDASSDGAKCDTVLHCENRTEIEHARMVLEAHENLVAVDENNRAKFQDVLAFLKNRVEQ